VLAPADREGVEWAAPGPPGQGQVEVQLTGDFIIQLVDSLLVFLGGVGGGLVTIYIFSFLISSTN
jgi:hypothetical protein